jgi:hypothetical protein
MSIGVILILAAIAWLFGPFAVQLAGGAAIALAAIVLGVEPGGRTVGGVGLGVIGALLLCAGSIWRIHREDRTCTAAGGWVRERVAKAILRGSSYVRARRWLAIRIAWRLPRWRLDQLFGDAYESAGSEPLCDGANGGANGGEQAGGYGSADGGGQHEADVPYRTLAEWFDATCPAEPWDPGAPAGGVRDETGRALEDVRRYLEATTRGLFRREVGQGWSSALQERRVARLGWTDGVLSPKHGEVLGDPRVLFSVIAGDWTMIGACFMRDPSPAAKELLAILARYEDHRSREDDAANATQAFREILAALRPHAREMLTDSFSYVTRPRASSR